MREISPKASEMGMGNKLLDMEPMKVNGWREQRTGKAL